MPLFKKGKGDSQQAASKEPAFAPIDRYGLLGLLDEVVNGGQSGVLELREPRGTWVYGFQGGALTHASGGRIRGARQAFDLLWEFQAGEFMFTNGTSGGPPGNLYIDKGRLLELLHRSQAALQGPSAPYIPPGQERVVPMPPRPFSPSPGRFAPQWQPGMPPAQPMAPGFGTTLYPQAPGMAGAPYPASQYPQGAPPPVYPQQFAPQPGMPPQMMPPQAIPPQGMPPLPPPPVQPMPQMQPMPPLPMPPIQPMQPMQPMQQMPPAMPQQPMPFQQMPQVMPAQPMPPAAPPGQARPVTPGAFSVPPMPIPKKRDAIPSYQPPVASGSAPAPAPAAPAVEPSKPKDDLAALRETLVKQAPHVQQAPQEPTWKMRTAEGAVAPPAAAEPLKKAKRKEKGKSKLAESVRIQLIKFLLWTMERKYSPDDHWTLKDAFEISTMELRDQFFSAFSQTLKSTAKEKSSEEDDIDDIGAGRMRGRARRH